jgi:hypothetical protein
MGDQVIRIQGGLPALPGTNITMPEHPTMNGHQILSSTGAAHPAAARPGPAARDPWRRPMTPCYNTPRISPKLLLEVMWEETVDLPVRLDAADKAAQVDCTW